MVRATGLFRSSRPDYIETILEAKLFSVCVLLFRSSRPDYIETFKMKDVIEIFSYIVPVFQTGLH